jgi:hypothetical protein
MSCKGVSKLQKASGFRIELHCVRAHELSVLSATSTKTYEPNLGNMNIHWAGMREHIIELLGKCVQEVKF